MENVILIDFSLSGEWEFHTALEKASGRKWKIKTLVSNQHGGILLKILRYWKYFSLPFEIFCDRKKYAAVLAWQQFYGLILAFYLRLFRVKEAPEITVMTFIYKPKDGVVGKIYAWFIKYVVTSGYIKKYIVFSESEKQFYAELFKLPEELFVAEKLGIEDVSFEMSNSCQHDLYYVAAGRSNRDYEFLRNAWPKTAKNIKIICDTCKDKNTSNITYFRQCHDKDYFKELAGSYATVVPLENETISSGQLVFLQSMMFGKPIIVTKNDTIYDYIIDDENGLIIDKNPESLKNALLKLEDKEYYNKLSNKARAVFEKEFTLYAMGLRIGSYV